MIRKKDKIKYQTHLWIKVYRNSMIKKIETISREKKKKKKT